VDEGVVAGEQALILGLNIAALAGRGAAVNPVKLLSPNTDSMPGINGAAPDIY